jgi:hypothetical protein
LVTSQPDSFCPVARELDEDRRVCVSGSTTAEHRGEDERKRIVIRVPAFECVRDHDGRANLCERGVQALD